ncbi:hypothetical protein [Anaeromyxobacter oryzae]|uniref:Uncharacterized protein n=1 Tax=Anaeromyxobacter oryzae TaxID=2918170 RepID=A0ABN6MRJ1_9BACT|nr:hypothetical protein [Anaeromyxobacter oryzae]BDG03619.1 hypothetical protein AMOR_26150 [Anaeromyxobacter oryzae]
MPPRLRWIAALAVALAAAPPVRAGAPGAAPDEAPPPSEARGPEVVRLRFGWTAPAEAQVTYRRTRSRTGARPTVFVARYASRVEREAEGLSVRTSRTRWEGDLPFPRAVADAAIRASERVLQRVGLDGEFVGLDDVEAMRPVLTQLLADAKIPPEQGERAIALGLAGMRAESEELWNLAVGFWIGADLELAAPYVMQTEAELPLVPGVRAASAVEFEVRRRVPCAAAEREARCVEVTLRSTPEPAALERARAEIAARLAPDAPPDEPLADLALESELLLVTDPATLLPRRLVWTKSIRAGGGEKGPPALELVDRSEYDYRYDAPRLRSAPPPRRPKQPAAPAPSPVSAAR